MKNILFALLLISLPCVAQSGWIFTTGVPSGTCTGYTSISIVGDGSLWTCASGTWTKYGSSDILPYPSVGIPNSTGTAFSSSFTHYGFCTFAPASNTLQDPGITPDNVYMSTGQANSFSLGLVGTGTMQVLANHQWSYTCNGY